MQLSNQLLFLSITFVFGQQKRLKSFVERVDDVDNVKKILRTKNNVLILYTVSPTSNVVSKVAGLLTDVSGPLYGKSTLVMVDCSSDDGKRTCKKMKASPNNTKPFLLLHYNNGKFHKEYDRSLTEASLSRFLADPTADLPWEEEADSVDVYHVADAKTWRKTLQKEKRPILAMFYAPWCGYCKKMKPQYSAAASSLKSEAVLAALDVTRPELYELQTVYNISGFPTLIYFANGQLKFPYGGEHTKDGIVKWIKNPSPGSPSGSAVEEITWSDEKSDVVHLTDKDFHNFIASHQSVLVMFYAPWCGHCKAMKPDYVEAAKMLTEQHVKGVLAAVDATREKDVADKFDVKGFPSVKYFKDGRLAWDFNERAKEKIVQFMKNPEEPPAPEKPWTEEESNVVHLSGDGFKFELKKRKHALVMFYAPWCGHCKMTKPEFTLAADHFKDNDKVTFAAVDCTDENNQFVCKGQDIRGFPTLRYFNYFKNQEDYLGGRSASDFVGYIEAQFGPPAQAAEEPLPPATEPDTSETGYTQQDEDDTSDLESWGFVKLLTPDNYERLMNSYDRTLVFFFSPTCRYCHETKPEFKAAAFRIRHRKDVALAAMDCVEYFEKCMDFRVAGYPSYFLFEKTKYVDIHHGKPTRENFVRTVLVDIEADKGEKKTGDDHHPKPPSMSPPTKSEL